MKTRAPTATKKMNTKKMKSRAQLSLEAMLSFAAYAALVAAFVFAARQAGDAAAPRAALAKGSVEANSACFVLEYAEINSRHTLADLQSLAKITAGQQALEKQTAGAVETVCAANARSQGKTVVKQNEKEQV